MPHLSRLDRLFILLENSSSAVTRKAAARQLGDVAQGHSSDSKELHALLRRLLELLSSKNWDTRVAAASALGLVLSNVPLWDPSPTKQEDDSGTSQWKIDSSAGVETIKNVLQSGVQLSANTEPIHGESVTAADTSAERLQREKLLLNQKLGLDIAATLGIDTSAIICNEDLICSVPSTPNSNTRESAVHILANIPDGSIDGRPSNKRAALQNQGPPVKRVRRNSQDDSAPEDDGEWPLLWLSGELLQEMFSGNWETRHGAATALRELLTKHGCSGGRRNTLSALQMEASHEWWLWCVCQRLVCVLALDSFGDYLSDQVVAPVRETVAQSLGVACTHLQASTVHSVVELLKELLSWRDSWSARHGGLLGLKYLLAARSDLRPTLLQQAYHQIFAGLKDTTDDVVGIAAECLTVCCSVTSRQPQSTTSTDPLTSETTFAKTEISSVEKTSIKRETSSAVDSSPEECVIKTELDTKPVEKNSISFRESFKIEQSAGRKHSVSLVEWLPRSELQELLSRVWQSLLHVDDLSAFTPALLLLLANLVQQCASISGLEQGRLSELVPRLFPLLYHSSSSVRKSALTTLLALTDVNNQRHASSKGPNNNRNGSDNGSQKDDESSMKNNLTENKNHTGTKCQNIGNSAYGIEKQHCVSSPSNLESCVQSSSPSVPVGSGVEHQSKISSDPSVERLDDKSQLSHSASLLSHEESKPLPADVHMFEVNNVKDREIFQQRLQIFRLWCEPILSPLLRHLFQRSLLETCFENFVLLQQVWSQILEHCSLNVVLMCACPLVSSWLALSATPHSHPLDPAALLVSNVQNPDCGKSKAGDQPVVYSIPSIPCYIGGSQHCKKTQLIACKSYAAKLIGELSLYVSQPMAGVAYSSHEEPLMCYTRLLLSQLSSCSAHQRLSACAVVREWSLVHSARRRDIASTCPSPSFSNGTGVHNHAKTEENVQKTENSFQPTRYLAYFRPDGSLFNGGAAQVYLSTDQRDTSVVAAATATVPGKANIVVNASETNVTSSETTSITVPVTGTTTNDTASITTTPVNNTAPANITTPVNNTAPANTTVPVTSTPANITVPVTTTSVNNTVPVTTTPADTTTSVNNTAPANTTVPVTSSSTNSVSVKTCSTSAMAELHASLLNCLTQPLYYDEIAVAFTRLQQDCRDFLALLKHYGLTVPDSLFAANVLTLDQMDEAIQGRWVLEEMNSTKLRPKIRNTMEERRRALQSSLSNTSSMQESFILSVRGKAAGAMVRLGHLPPKLNPVVKPLMDVIKLQDHQELQSDAGRDLSLLLQMCGSRDKSPNAKVVKNLAAFYCVDHTHTPNIVHNAQGRPPEDRYDGVFFIKALSEDSMEVKPTSLDMTAKQIEAPPAPVKRKRGRPPSKPKTDAALEVPPPPPAQLPPPSSSSSPQLQTETELAKFRIKRRGCGLALQHTVRCFGINLPQQLPVLWALIFKSLATSDHHTSNGKNKSDSASLAQCPFSVANLLCRSDSKDGTENDSNNGTTTDSAKTSGNTVTALAASDAKAQDIVNWLQLLEVVVPVLHPKLLDEILTQLSSVELLLYHRYCAVRHMAARVLATLVEVRTAPVMLFLLERLLPALSDVHSTVRRQGAVECLHMVVHTLRLHILPYIVLLLVPLLGSSSDSDASVRAAGSEVFAALIRLLPLDGSMPDPPDMPASLCAQRHKHRDFLYQLMDGNKAHHYPLPVTVDAKLREYQQAGVNWLAFLRDFGVHGILCDDMGLGKTLQTICILAATHYEYQKRVKSGEVGGRVMQSLVICPPTLTGHWVHEIQKFVSSDLLQPLNYTGIPAERMKLRLKFNKHNIIVASYDIVRNDVDFITEFQWLYVVLDEGHVVKNTKTKAYQAIKRLSGRHRLILSGTPIQNNVLELWSLFDFLMPGYLGSERQFSLKYSKPILASRDAKASSSDQEAGVIAMESLHRQALPFMMRRLKEDVLKELPPKITQDYYCELSPVQRILYEDFMNAQGTDFQDDQVPKAHVFQALQYLRLVCNHPALVLRPQHPRFTALLNKAGITPSDLSSISLAAKLPALKELLIGCGIGTSNSNQSSAVDCVVAPHRALIFCQLRTMLDIIEDDLFRCHMPGVTYVRLDGAVPAGLRYGLVQRFNQDPSIDVMLLTTQVGGLGLNLTAADTVIFVEHDWNPMKDLQAMDRAHRIGQQRVVTVYRLITRNTLEEKIMGLQKFKLMTANTIISKDNANISSMGTEQILDLFSLEESKKKLEKSSDDGHADSLGVGAPKAVLENLPELWEQSQYHDEYDLDKFLSGISK